MRKIYVEAAVRGKYDDKDVSKGLKAITDRFQKVIDGGLRAFAVEVRRRARIRLARNRSPYPSGSDTRYPSPLKDNIEFLVDPVGRTIIFDVGGNLPYAKIEDQQKTEGTFIYGNPVMRFYWYRLQKPMRVNRPGYVIRYGKNFFSGALDSALNDFDKIFGRHWNRVTKKQ